MNENEKGDKHCPVCCHDESCGMCGYHHRHYLLRWLLVLLALALAFALGFKLGEYRGLLGDGGFRGRMMDNYYYYQQPMMYREGGSFQGGMMQPYSGSTQSAPAQLSTSTAPTTTKK